METKNPKRPNKKGFLDQISELSRKDRQLLAVELLDLVDKRLPDIKKQLHSATLQELKYLRNRFIKKQKLKLLGIFKLYLVAYYPVAEINHWTMTAHQCFRTKKPGRDPWAHIPRETKRSPTIRDVNGMALPMNWRKKFLPAWVRTQQDYETYSANPKLYQRLERERLLSKGLKK